MKKTYWATLIAFTAYLFWEFAILEHWKATTDGPLIRVDLVLIYAVLGLLLVLSFFRFFLDHRSTRS